MKPRQPHALSDGHWSMELFRERMSTKDWREHLLHEDDTIIFNGRVRRLVAKSLGCGVVEVSKAPVKEGE